MRKSFSVVSHGLFWTQILASNTSRSWSTHGCTSAYENLQNLMIRARRWEGGQGARLHHRTSSTHRQDAIERYCSVRVDRDFLRLEAVQ